MRLTGNTILITGGTSGIGRSLAEAFQQRGNQVIIAGRRQHLLNEITAAHPGMRGVQLDVKDPGAVDAFAAHIREQFPKLNVLINNAGISKPEDLTAGTIDLSVALSIIHTNIVSVLQLTAALLPTLKHQPDSTLIATSSGLAFMPAPLSLPTAPVRRFFTPGCSRSAFSSGKRPWRSSNLSRRMCKRNLAGPVRRVTPTQCRWPTILLK